MLKIKGLVVAYETVQVLHGISIEVPKGSVVCLIGSNGAGKTTTMRAISGMIAPKSGQIELNGKSIAGLPSHRVAQLGCGHSPEGRKVFPALSVQDNLMLGAYSRLTGQRPRGDVAADLARVYGLFPRLEERKKQSAGTLSGGEQQMLAMGRALMLNPEVLLLDEPSLGLAPKLVQEVFQFIKLLKQSGTTMLLVEQFAAAALAVADYGYVLENGRITIEGPARDLKSNEQVINAYLGKSHSMGPDKKVA